MDLYDVIDRLRDNALRDMKEELAPETVQRAHLWVSRRIGDGVVTSEGEVRAAFAGFADGFCTGFHRGKGVPCASQHVHD